MKNLNSIQYNQFNFFFSYKTINEQHNKHLTLLLDTENQEHDLNSYSTNSTLCSSIAINNQPFQKSIPNSNYLKKKLLQENNNLQDYDENENIWNPKIIIFGICPLHDKDIVKTIKDRLLQTYRIVINAKNIRIITADKSSKLKNMSPVDSLKSNKYDYLIVGPHPHSIKGKNIKHNWESFLKYRKLDAKVFEGYNKPISKFHLLKITSLIGEDILFQSSQLRA